MKSQHEEDSLHLRLAMAEKDLKAADDANLTTATNAALISVNVKLRTSLADLIHLVRSMLNE